ncbi:MAG: XdhC family protein [Halobacteriales archaeon]
MDTDRTDDPWGVPTMELYRRLRATLESDRPAAVATVVDVEGSAYRRPGAKMVIDPEGDSVGGITAGCLEGPLRDLAESAIAAGSPALRTFDLTEGGEFDVGLGCNGVVTVLVEPLDASWEAIASTYLDGHPATVVTALEGPGVARGDRSLVDPDGEMRPVEGRERLPSAVEARLADVPGDAGSHRRAVETDDGNVEVFIDHIEPPTRLVVFGAQPDVRPVTRLARDVGLHVTVATARGGRADPEAFPAAHAVVTTHPDDLDEVVGPRDHVVVMSHNYVDDLLALERLLETDVPYIGLMGPRKRFEELRDDLAEAGVSLEGDRERLSTPVGLDLGGGEPVQVALSIVAEVVAVNNGRDGGRLRDRAGPIHGRVPAQPD